jgi:septum site-determining protein MinC
MAKDSPIQFKGTTLKIIQTQLRTADAAQLHTALADLTGNAPDFFEGELSVLDFSQAALSDITVDWPSIVKLLRQSGLNPVATSGLPDDLATHAALAGLPTVSADDFSNKSPKPAAKAGPDAVEPAPPPTAAPTAAPVVKVEPAPAPEVVPTPAPATIILDKPLRSGQRFYARGGDLIITAMVSAGAEVIADGNIHVYAPLRGRALAGANGNREARIFTTSLEAELVSIAGIYRTFEGSLPRDLAQQPAVIRLSEEDGNQRLQIAPLALR